MQFLLATVGAYIFTFSSSFQARHSIPSVNTDQTSHMDPKIRDFQSKSLPLGRFAEVKYLWFFWQLVNTQPIHICRSLTRWLGKHSFCSPSTPPTWRVVNISSTGQLLVSLLWLKISFPDHFIQRASHLVNARLSQDQNFMNVVILLYTISDDDAISSFSYLDRWPSVSCTSRRIEDSPSPSFDGRLRRNHPSNEGMLISRFALVLILRSPV